MSGGRLTPEVGPDDHVLRPAHARVTLVEYGDYECPHCRRAAGILAYVLDALAGDVRFVFRNFPLSESHPHAMAAAEAAESVAAHAGPEAFWAMHDILYRNQEALQPDDLLAYAESAAADPKAVADDLASGAMRARVRRDFDSGIRSGVNGTPTFFINGRRFDGDWQEPMAFAETLRAAR